MSQDEPLSRGKKADITSASLARPVRDQVRFIASLAGLVNQLPMLRTREVPESQPLTLTRRHPLDVKLQYCRRRMATADQLFAARHSLNLGKQFDYAAAINLQRVFEAADYDPVRNWRYYPVVDQALGTGVPRSQVALPMLRFVEVVVEYNEQLVVFCGDYQSTYYLNHESDHERTTSKHA